MRAMVSVMLMALIGLATTPAHAQAPGKTFQSAHVATLNGKKVPYTATVEEFVVPNKAGSPGARLVATSYVADKKAKGVERPTIFLFNGGPIVAAIGLHLQFGPERQVPSSGTGGSAPAFENNPYSLLDVGDLIVFDPAETGYSRVINESDRPYFYSTDGDCESLANLVIAWRERHQRTASPLFLLGESYGSIRQVATGAKLIKRGIALNGQIILGDSIFLQETSRRTHNIISTATSLPLLAMTAAYHGKADKHGKSDADFLNEVYAYAMSDYLIALSKGYTLPQADRQTIADRLTAYTGIPADYFLNHGLTIAKQDFNRQLLDGKILNANDTRIATPLPPPPKNQEEAERQQSGDRLDPMQKLYASYYRQELKVEIPGVEFQVSAPHAFEVWDWGTGCNDYLLSAGLCNRTTSHPSIFMDYDYPEVLKAQFSDPKFRAMIISSYYDGLSSIGTHRYLAAQLGFPADRFSIHEYAAGHMTAGDPVAQPKVTEDIRQFIAGAR